MNSRSRRLAGHALFLIAIVLTYGYAAQVSRADESRVGVAIPGLATSKLECKLQGLVLLEELNCLACHASEGAPAAASKVAPRLSAVGSRVNPNYLENFIQDPHSVKAGTTMPDVMSHLDADARQKTAGAITHYLLSLNKKGPAFDLQAIDAVAAENGERLFHSVGCVACHSPRNEQGEESLAEDSTPLGDLSAKYNTASLAEFLRAPHRIRPAGRMPDMKLSGREAEQIAHYLLRTTKVPGHLRYTLLRGRVWEGLEVNVTREKAGLVKDFELASLPPLPGNSAILYEGLWNVTAAGEYTFFLEMNGGQLALNDVEIVNLPPSPRRGVKKIDAKQKLSAGWNKIQLTYIHAGKEPGLRFEIAGPGIERQAIDAAALSISQAAIAPFRPYVVDKSLAARGKIHFTELGCVKCHDDVPGDANSLKLFAPLAKLDPARGCLSEADGDWPHFQLSAKQRELLRPLPKEVETMKLNERELVNKSLVTFNCIACHQRDELGGVSPERNALFVGARANSATKVASPRR